MRSHTTRNRQLSLDAIKGVTLDSFTKGLSLLPDEHVRLGDVGQRRWSVPEGDLDFPVLLLKESALAANIALMADFCAQHDVVLAPHGKTTMSPQLFHRQLAAGSWGITVATISQCRALRRFGVSRILMANELVDPGAVRWIADELAQDPELEFLCYVDSIAGVECMERALAGRHADVRLPVLLELGSAGQRAGCRSEQEALLVAERVGRSPVLEMRGVAGFEGLFHSADLNETLDGVDSFLIGLRQLAVSLVSAGRLPTDREVVVTAGGSWYFDRVVEQLRPANFPFPVTTIVRSGCYVAHDAELFEETSPLGGRAPRPGDRLRQALELWATVLSRPEPDLAIVGFGKRDASYDILLPRPERVWNGDGSVVRDVVGQFTVESLNDQHAMMRVPAGDPIQVGDRVTFGINHPCTAFDKWRFIPMVDDDYRVTGGITTYF